MTSNFFHNDRGAKNEQALVESLVIEMLEISGRTYYYIPRTTNNIDNILNEVANASYTTFAPVTLYVENYQDFGGNQNLLSKFGLEAVNTASFVVARRPFADKVQARPLAGDLVYDPLSRLLFQIDRVDEEPSPAYALQKLYIFTLKCSLFQHSHEEFATNITKIDTDLDPDTFVTPFDKTDEITTEATEYLDFDENNPFSDIIPPEENP